MYIATTNGLYMDHRYFLCQQKYGLDTVCICCVQQSSGKHFGVPKIPLPKLIARKLVPIPRISKC